MLERLKSKGATGDMNQIINDKVTSLVPPLIKKIYPRMKDEMYNNLRHDIAFLKKTALFCEECTLHIQQSQEDNLKAQKSATEFYGTGRLKPESIKFRYLHTMRNITQTDGAQTTRNFFKYKSPIEAKTSVVNSARQSYLKNHNHSDLPYIFGDIKSIKSIKTL